MAALYTAPGCDMPVRQASYILYEESNPSRGSTKCEGGRPIQWREMTFP